MRDVTTRPVVAVTDTASRASSWPPRSAIDRLLADRGATMSPCRFAGLREPSFVVYVMFTTAASGYGLVMTTRSVLPSAVNPSAKCQVVEVSAAHCDVTSPPGNSSCCSTVPVVPTSSTCGTTTPTVRPRRNSICARERGFTMTGCCSIGSADMNDTDATRSVSPGFEMFTYALVTPSPAAAPGQNHEELMRRASETWGNAPSAPFATAAPSGDSESSLSTSTMPARLATRTRNPSTLRRRFIVHLRRTRLRRHPRTWTRTPPPNGAEGDADAGARPIRLPTTPRP